MKRFHSLETSASWEMNKYKKFTTLKKPGHYIESTGGRSKKKRKIISEFHGLWKIQENEELNKKPEQWFWNILLSRVQLFFYRLCTLNEMYHIIIIKIFCKNGISVWISVYRYSQYNFVNFFFINDVDFSKKFNKQNTFQF